MTFIPPIAVPLAPAMSIEGVISESMLDNLEKTASEAIDTGETGGGSTQRKSKVKWVPPVQPLYGLIADIVARANAVHWRFDLSGIFEQLQLARYEADAEGQYDWHQDFGSEMSSRKLSLSLQLTDADAYEGGDLQILKAAGDVMVAPRKRGTVIVFPSYQLHRVAPVTKGVRHSLVAWISGPSFK